MLTRQQKYLIAESFAQVAASAEAVPTIFYTRLFELDPSLRMLFRGDMIEQGRKLVQMLAFVVAQLDRPDILLPNVRRLGERHGGYGVRPEHYAVVGEALIWTLDQALGSRFTLETREAWIGAYELLSTTMQEAAGELTMA